MRELGAALQAQCRALPPTTAILICPQACRKVATVAVRRRAAPRAALRPWPFGPRCTVPRGIRAPRERVVTIQCLKSQKCLVKSIAQADKRKRGGFVLTGLLRQLFPNRFRESPMPDVDWRPLYPFASHELRLDGWRYHYLDEGEGEVLLLVHGNPTWSFYWRELIRRWRRIIA